MAQHQKESRYIFILKNVYALFNMKHYILIYLKKRIQSFKFILQHKKTVMQFLDKTLID